MCETVVCLSRLNWLAGLMLYEQPVLLVRATTDTPHDHNVTHIMTERLRGTLCVKRSCVCLPFQVTNSNRDQRGILKYNYQY